MQKKPSSTKTRANTGDQANRTRGKASDSARPIRSVESDAFVDRLREVIGDESVSSFARRCNIGESVIRGYLADGKRPGVDYLIALADAGNVTIEWLATGLGPRTRAELSALLDRAGAYADSFGPAIDKDRLLMAIKMTADALTVLGEPLTAERQADLVMTFYQRLTTQDGTGSVPKPVQK
jgi:transcriptional regulator with XRE-family HTH domain